MELTTKSPILILFMLLLPLALGVNAHQKQQNTKECNNATLSGRYGIQIEGTRPSSPGGPIETVIGVVVRTYDGEGGVSSIFHEKGSLSGFVEREISGTYEVHADCVSIISGEPFPGVFVEERGVIVDNGHQIFTMVASPPLLMVTGVGRKM